jgi:penicillin-binding protein 1C
MLKKRKKHIFFFLLILLLVLWFFSLPEKLFKEPYSTVMEDRNGVLLGAIIADDGQWRLPSNDTVPDKFKQSILLFEDKYFNTHPGVNPVSLFNAFMANIKAGKTIRGGSTITMQVMRLARKKNNRNVFQKIIEIFQATRLEVKYSKEKILRLYASHAPFGGNIVGLEAAAWRYFGQKPESLSWAESATLAVLPNAPSLIYPGKNQEKLLKKRNKLLHRLYAQQIIDSVTYSLSIAEQLPQKPNSFPLVSPHLLNKLIKDGHKGLKTKTTIDAVLQEKVMKIAEMQSKKLAANEIHNAAIMITDVQTGEVLAYVGNTKGKMHGNDVDIILSPRSSGSILKPFLFASLMKEGLVLPGALVADIPTQISGYSPKNFDMKYDGAVRVDRALIRSLNVPSVRLLQQFGVEKFLYTLNKIGFSTINNTAEHYGLSLILGGAETNLWDLSHAYAYMARILNNYTRYNGKYNEADKLYPTVIFRKTTAEKMTDNAIIDAGSAFLTLNALLEVNRPSEEAGWEEFASSKKIAWKTGTSYGFRDAWAVGITPRFVVACWAGNADGEGRPGLTGASAAAPVLFDIFSTLPASGWFETPFDNLEKIAVCKKSGYRTSLICEEADSVYVHTNGLRTNACPYHKIIHLDKKSGLQVNADCSSPDNIENVSWFLLPPVQEWYYKYKNHTYKPLPPFHKSCMQNTFSRSMEIISPPPGSRLKIPLELDGTKGEIVFSAAHRSSNSEIFWHLDAEYVGTTKGIHKLSLSPEKGLHRLTLVDETGEELIYSFEVL